MIVADTSAIIAIIRREDEEGIFTDLLDSSSSTVMSRVSFVEAHMVTAGRRSRPDIENIESTIAALGIDVVDVTDDQARWAIRGFLTYGKGRHPARLNLADCFAYALAKSRGGTLLFKGDDFSKTDIVPAWQP